ncbi:MAG: DUF3794 domain-containing protein [Ruminococcaceae bacterium]|nr:DUF3794 domain-containing protein [Oscillospiraceae bacterium]
MEFTKSPVSVCEYKKTLRTKTNLEADVIVPDTRPDIVRVLNVKALADVNECYMRKDKVIFSGKTKFTILYVGEGDMNKIYSIEYSLPFNHQADMPGADENTVPRSLCNVSDTSFDVRNSRKLSVGATLDLCVDAYRGSDIDAISGTGENSDIPSKSKEYNFDILVASENFEINLSDSLTLPVTEDNCEIFDIDIRPDVSDIKTVNNKAIVKGNANISVFYSSDGEISTYETESAFTEIVDINAMQAQQSVISSFEVADSSCSTVPSDSGVRLDVDFKLKGNLSAYENKDFIFASDIYSPDYSYNVKSRKVHLLHIEKCNPFETTVKDTISLSNSDAQISKIHYMDAMVSCLSVNKDETCINLKGNVENVVIYTDEENCLNRKKHTTPFEMQIPCLSKDLNSSIDAFVSLVSHSFALASSREIQTRVVVKANAKLTLMEEVNIITDFSVDQTTPIRKNSQAGIVVFYPTKGTDIWAVAKKYNTTCEEIIKINSLDPSCSTLGDKPVLIPKRQKS